MFQGLLLPLSPAEHISQDYIFYSWSYFPLIFWWQGHMIFLALWATHQHLCVGLGHAVSVADHSGGRCRQGSRARPRWAVMSACAPMVGWSGPEMAVQSRNVHVTTSPQANIVPQDVALATKHFHCTFTAYKAPTHKRLKVGGSVSSILSLSLSLSCIFSSLWSWLNLVIPRCGLHAPTFPLTNTHFQWGGGAEFTSMTQGTLTYT